MDREKVIAWLADEELYYREHGDTHNSLMACDALALLKEQEGKQLRCKTCTMRDKTGFCHRWNIEVKDDDYCSFGAWKGC